MHKLIVVFDLDDTLYNEIDYLESAYYDIAIFLSKKINKAPDLILSQMMYYYKNGLNVFDDIIKTHTIKDVTIQDLLSTYREHQPNITLAKSSTVVLSTIKKDVFKVGLITDGRRVQQRHKIKALGLSEYFDDIIISEEFGSEKPNVNNFKFYSDKYGDSYTYIYIGDNTNKDFIAPNSLGWSTICLLDNGKNIHKQTFDSDLAFKPRYVINDLGALENMLLQIK